MDIENNEVGRPPYIKTEEGNVVAQIFWLKTQAGWKEKNYHELTGKDDSELFGEERQLIEIRKLFNEINFIKPKNITEASIVVQDSKTETDNS